MTGENADLRDCYETKIQAAASARLSPDPDAAGRPGRGPFSAGDQAPAEQRPEQHYAAVHTEKAFDALVELRFVVVQKERKI